MKLKILVGCAGDNYAYRKGDEYDDVPKEVADDLINAGFAIAIDPPKTERATTLPTEKAKKK